jgi:hypothetical protein
MNQMMGIDDDDINHNINGGENDNDDDGDYDCNDDKLDDDDESSDDDSVMMCRCRDGYSMIFPSKPIVRTRLWAMSQCVNMYCMT